ncbi:MAG TPA: hypothetical protein HPP87_08190 [Planctomycetes bacterium]|nr:hypothetical protein [Planctomycetota bacterium]HIJ71327.1 hypothetical protein [Planctomycetota bacterium]
MEDKIFWISLLVGVIGTISILSRISGFAIAKGVSSRRTSIAPPEKEQG